LSSAGDLDGDTKADIVVGAYRHTVTNVTTGKPMKQAGAVYGYSCVNAGIPCVRILAKRRGSRR
jgi:hypothetical protein